MDKEPLFEILDESPDYVVVNKPGNLVCHPTKGDARSSLIGRLRLHYEGQPEVEPSFINRLDRETSGIVWVAKTPSFQARMQKMFQGMKVQKIYHAVVTGVPNEPEGVIRGALGREPGARVVFRQAIMPDGKAAETGWRVIRSGEKFSLLEVQPRTGRLHQIRVHLAFMGHPVVGDKLYGPDPGLYMEFVQSGWTPALEEKLLVPRQLLHASELRMESAGEGVGYHWKAPMPEDMGKFCGKNFTGIP